MPVTLKTQIDGVVDVQQHSQMQTAIRCKTLNCWGREWKSPFNTIQAKVGLWARIHQTDSWPSDYGWESVHLLFVVSVPTALIQCSVVDNLESEAVSSVRETTLLLFILAKHRTRRKMASSAICDLSEIVPIASNYKRSSQSLNVTLSQS